MKGKPLRIVRGAGFLAMITGFVGSVGLLIIWFASPGLTQMQLLRQYWYIWIPSAALAFLGAIAWRS